MHCKSNAWDRYLPHRAGATLRHLICVYPVQLVHPPSVTPSVPVPLGQHIFSQVCLHGHTQVI